MCPSRVGVGRCCAFSLLPGPLLWPGEQPLLGLQSSTETRHRTRGPQGPGDMPFPVDALDPAVERRAFEISSSSCLWRLGMPVASIPSSPAHRPTPSTQCPPSRIGLYRFVRGCYLCLYVLFNRFLYVLCRFYIGVYMCFISFI